MKSIVVSAVLMMSTMAFAQAQHEAGQPAAPAAHTAEATTKMTKKDAKAACKAEGKKGKDLKHCIKEKTM